MRELVVLTVLMLALFLIVPVDLVVADELTDINLYIDPLSYEVLAFDVEAGVRFYGEVRSDRGERANYTYIHVMDSENYAKWIGGEGSYWFFTGAFGPDAMAFDFTVPTADIWRFCFINADEVVSCDRTYLHTDSRYNDY